MYIHQRDFRKMST